APGCFARAAWILDEHPEVNLTFGREFIIEADDPMPAIDEIPSDVRWQISSGPEILERICGTGRPDADIFMIGSTTAVVRTSAQKRVGYYRAALPHTADFEMWMRFACSGAMAETNAVQGIRRVHPACRSASSIRDVHAWNLLYQDAFESFFGNEGAR